MRTASQEPAEWHWTSRAVNQTRTVSQPPSLRHLPSAPPPTSALHFDSGPSPLCSGIRLPPAMNPESRIDFMAAPQSRKRPHREISESRSLSPWEQYPQPSSSNNTTTHNHFSSSRPILPPLPHMRFPGDGFDFRRPIMSTPHGREASASRQEDVIDLTNEPDHSPLPPQQSTQRSRPTRPPRFGRNIMAEDIVDLEDTDSMQNHAPSSPEVQFLGSTSRAPDPSRPQSSTRQRHQERLPHVGIAGSSLYDMLQRLRHEALPVYREERPREYNAFRDREQATTTRRRRPMPFPLPLSFPQALDTFILGETPDQGIDLTIDLDNDNMVPVQLDYTTTGFGSDVRRRPASPAYEPPPAAPEGFTRTVKEDEMVVCPNCDHELGTGEDIRSQIWVAKPCGHVYCGLCTKHRAVSKGKRAERPPGSPTTKPFSRCVVADCGKSVSQPKAMFQLYL
ncbi:hypothetical protein AJ80_00685 [Polytolypa hystricis UAMH7299]|uniref:Uncharacterized protein n=1 Tax=Polytolypa hystricis (strain UAMH7299) TaxID=1447883 RepID=A0A2B7Z2N9_POLH7|nr:hypothetical protein AJ80_00685 [Polytolypa hystricis UAMH7299]